MSQRSLLSSFIFIFSSFIAPFALAGSNSTTFLVTATVLGTCTITATPLAFVDYNVTTDLDAQSTIVLACVLGTGNPITVGLDAGQHSPDSTTRRMAGTTATTNYLTYQLYKPASSAPLAACAYTNLWGNAGAGLFTAAPILGLLSTFNVCGRIPAGQTGLLDNAYTDTVTATVNFP